MNADQDHDTGGTVITMQRSKMSIREALAPSIAQPAAPHVIPDEGETEPPPSTVEPELADPLPRPGGAYKAHGRHGNKPQATLFFVTRGHVFEGFSYAYLERIRLKPPETAGGSLVLVLRFSGSVATEVTVEGRNLHAMCNLIGLHLLPWIWEMPGRADRHGEAATVVTRITVGDAAG
jgi:hypothetical protein